MRTATIQRLIKIIRYIVLGLWIGFLLFCIGYCACYPSTLSSNYLSTFFQKFEGFISVVYVTISILRGFTLLPSTPFILAGAMIFPEHLLFVFFVSLLGAIISSALIYHFAHLMGFDSFFEKKYPQKIGLMQKRMNQKRGALFIIGWVLFPFVPTDLLCYVAGIIRMNFTRFILAMFLGYLPSTIFYLYLGKYMAVG